MRHRKDGRQFSRNTSHRRAMFRNLAANLVNHERIVTTDAKAKELRRVAEKLITKAKRLGEIAYTPQADLSKEDKARRLHVSRLLAAYLPRWGVQTDGTKRDLVDKLLIDLSKRFAERKGGYTRIIKLGIRKGDGAAMSVIEFVDAQPVVPADDPVEAVEPEKAETKAVEAAAAEPEKAETKAAEPEEASSQETKDEE